MNQINPTLPTPGYDLAVWGKKNNDVHTAVITKVNELDTLVSNLPETIRDTIGAALIAGANVTISVDDAAETITISSTGGGGSGALATVDGASVSTLNFVSTITADDVGALPLPKNTPVVGYQLALASLNPLTLTWVAPTVSGGGSSGGSGFGVNVLTQGVKNDGIILNDLTVTSGSATITSESAPFKTTAIDQGKLVYYRTSSGVGTATIQSVTNTKTAVLTANATSSSVINGGPNNNSVFGTDNTNALNTLFAAVQANQIAYGDFRAEQTPTAQVYFPYGVYVTRALSVMKAAGVICTGDGMRNTYIASGDDNPWFQLDTLNQYYAYSGKATYWEFHDLQFINPCHRNGDSAGNRKGIAVQDNGSGNALFVRCRFVGLRYGFASPTASDFTKMYNCYFYLCDVGTYFGPGSQQLDLQGCDWALCREGAVFEGAPVWHIGGGPSFEDNVVSSVTIEAKSSGATRFGCPVDLGGAYYSGNFVIDGGGWFETNSGGNGALTPRQILITGDGPFGAPFEGLVVRDMAFIAGGTQVNGGTNTLVEINTSRTDSQNALTLHNVSISNPSFVNSAVRNSGSATSLKVLQLFCQFPSQVTETQGSITLRAQRRNGTISGFTVS